MRKGRTGVAHRRVVPPEMSGSAPSNSPASIRRFLNEIVAVTPCGSGAVRALCTATARGFGGGLGPLEPAASAMAVHAAPTATTDAHSRIRRLVEMRRRKGDTGGSPWVVTKR